MTPQPLKGRRVVEFSQFIAGPTAAQMLADYGAEVIKVEPPRGDGSRALPGGAHGSAYFRSFNTSKDSHVLDMATQDGQAAFAALLDGAEALICNVAPRALKKLSLDPENLRRRFPHLVATLISGFGQDDDRSCMDTIAQCESGFAWMNGNLDGTPRVSTSWPVDFYSGHYAGMATAMAMLDPVREGGMIVDLSMMEVASAMLLGPAAVLAAEGMPLGAPSGNRDRASAPSGIYRCSDGHVYIYGGLDAYWRALNTEIGAPDASFAERLERAGEYDAHVEAWTGDKTAQDVLAIMARLRIPAGAVRHPAEALDRIRRLRPGAGVTLHSDGQAIPAYPALFDGARIARTPAPPLAGPNEPTED
ncbi:CaiB/BaiF CoA transferase family protein [Anianabacter salinae]|uniref:CaiB/BaiF CoA transferase family protein n=1 Tax=Anianabacter salinae TaxID=2851023 RepID=UPI00225DD951|nr:CoA transferase [Anianabacter salinae]MBV0911857.1 CoA transferase [Anianabacter salinae]